MMALIDRRSAFATSVRQLWAAGHLHWAVWIFGVAFLLRAAWIAYVNPDPFHGTFLERGGYDAVFYYGSAQSLADGEGFRSPWNLQYSAILPPGYPLMLAPLFVLFGSHLVVAKLFNVFLGAVTAVLVYALATEIRGQRAGIVAGGLMALFPSQIFFSTVIMTETLFVALSVVLVLLLVVWLAKQESMRGWQVFVLGLLLGFMSLVRAEALLLVPAVVVLWKLRGVSWRRLGGYLLVFLVGMFILIAPWTARNYARFGEFILVRGKAGAVDHALGVGPSGEIIILEGEGDAVDQVLAVGLRGNLTILPEKSDALSRAIRVGLSPDYDNRFKYELTGEAPPTYGELWTHYGTQPWQLFTLARKKLVDLFGDDDAFFWIQGYYSVPPLSPEEASRWSLVANWYYFVVGAGVLLGAPFWLSLRDRRLLILLWFIVSWSLIHLMFVPVIRYHFPVIPMLCVLAAIVFVGVWDRLTEARAPAARPAGTART